MSALGKRAQMQGTLNQSAKLNEDKVREIRSLRGQMTQKEIAKKFGICSKTVNEIQLFQTWKHIQ